MTRYGWDASDYDWARGPMDVAAAHKQGIDLLTHKISEGTGFRSAHAGTVLQRGLAAGVPVLGGYHVLYPKTMAPVDAQVDWYVASLDALFRQWRKHPCFIHQVDAEKFKYMPREPSIGEINTFAKKVMAKAGCVPTQVIVYGPHWLYGERLSGLHDHPLWASAYVDGAGDFKALYPGDDDERWAEYSGIVPTALQFSSLSTIAGQHPSDANALRVATVDELVALFVPKHDQAEEDDMTMSPHERAKLISDIAAAVAAQPITAHDGTKMTIGSGVAQGERHAHAADHALTAHNGVLARVALIQQAVAGLKVGPVDVGQIADAVVTRIGTLLGGGK